MLHEESRLVSRREKSNKHENEWKKKEVIGYYFSGHFRNKGVSVVDDGVFVFAIPEIQLDAPTSAEQRLPVDFHR